MQAITTIGLDIAKSVFQVHGVDAAGQVTIRRQLKRRYVLAFFPKLSPCLRRHRSLRSSTIGPRRAQGPRPYGAFMPPCLVKPSLNGRRTTPLTRRRL